VKLPAIQDFARLDDEDDYASMVDDIQSSLQTQKDPIAKNYLHIIGRVTSKKSNNELRGRAPPERIGVDDSIASDLEEELFTRIYQPPTNYQPPPESSKTRHAQTQPPKTELERERRPYYNLRNTPTPITPPEAEAEPSSMPQSDNMSPS
jgi:hypothetical protein